MFVIAAFLGILIRLLTRHEAERRKLGRPAALDLIASIRSWLVLHRPAAQRPLANKQFNTPVRSRQTKTVSHERSANEAVVDD